MGCCGVGRHLGLDVRFSFIWSGGLNVGCLLSLVPLSLSAPRAQAFPTTPQREKVCVSTQEPCWWAAGLEEGGHLSASSRISSWSGPASGPHVLSAQAASSAPHHVDSELGNVLLLLLVRWEDRGPGAGGLPLPSCWDV